ncbi:MAG: glutamate 5-kinase [Pseudomonadota bacterium]
MVADLDRSALFSSAETVIVKIGSSALMKGIGNAGLENSQDPSPWLKSFADDLASLTADGKRVLLVSSGAVALGCTRLGWGERPQKLADAQAAAAVGQAALIELYEAALASHNILPAQLLLSRSDLEDRRRYLNARATTRALWDAGALPIFNENDTVTTEELRFGDNDGLAARLCHLVGADLLILLSNVDGVFSSEQQNDPLEDDFPEPLREIADPAALARSIPDETSAMGTGGMASKLAAAEVARHAGAHIIIANGTRRHPILRLQNEGTGSWIRATTTPKSARRAWLESLEPGPGHLMIDQGAALAVRTGASLLPVGILAVEGIFDKGSVVTLVTRDGEPVAKGLVAYAHDEASKLCGIHTEAIQDQLGYRGPRVVIHRDDMVILKAPLE